MAPGARSKFGAPMFETDLLEANVVYSFEESTSDTFGTFRLPPQLLGALCSDLAPHSDSAPEELRPPCPLRYALVVAPF